MNPTDNRTMKLLFFIGAAGLALLLILAATSPRQTDVTAASPGAQSVDGLWQNVDEALLRVEGERVIVPSAYRTVALNWDGMDSLLANAPDSLSEANEIILSLPLPDGGYGRFQIVQTAVMHPDLAAKFPEIRTFAGVGLDDLTAFARLDSTPKGFHAMILSANGRVFIDPYTNISTGLYQTYYANDFVPNLPADFEPDVVVEGEHEEGEKPAAPNGVSNSGGTLRTYRLAVGATGEYTQFHGGTVELGLAAIVTAVNRVAGIYEREVAVTFQLVADNDLVVYTDGATDPYTNDDGGAMLGENQTTLNARIGSANYDVGHAFSTDDGGIAGLGVVCTGAKAQGVTGRPSPINDPFYVDYVAHELGHQFSANHTFNGNTGSCGSFGQYNASTAYEPGSGTTIMAYAGICSPQNIQSNSDDYFHGISFDEIIAYTTAGNGNVCASTSATGNTPPSVEAGGSYNIPLNTPFTLTGSATDPDTTALTYNWEEFDLGPTGLPQFPSGNAPIFRSFPATTSSSRTFPQISDIVNNTQTLGELLPSYARTMNFRLTVRDNQVPAGGVGIDSTTVTAVSGTGPFLVTAPNTSVTWTGLTTETVTWNVAGTDQAPISCANVNIDLSTDGGLTYPNNLATSTPNDGSQNITVPNVNSSTARVRVSCADNIFFDISNANFTVQAVAGDPSLSVSKSIDPTGSVMPGETVTYTIGVENVGTAPANSTIITDTFATVLTNPSCNGESGDLTDTVVINPSSNVSYSCTAVVDSSLVLDVKMTAVPTEILSGEQVTYTITVTNSHGSLSLTNVQISAPDLSNCTPALNSPQTLGPGASQTYSCPNNVVSSPTPKTATATGEIAISNTAYASDPDDPGGEQSSSPVDTTVSVTGSDSAAVMLSDFYYLYLPLVTR